MGNRYAPVEERFALSVDRRGPDDCWEWRGCRVSGYGYMRYGRGTKAHRYALELALGRPLDPGKYACHHCDNKVCCNPAHLYEGTAQDNSDDAVTRGRTGRGTARRLRPEQKLPMRRRVDVARGQPTADDVDWEWWRQEDGAHAMAEVASFVARVDRGDIDARYFV